MFSMRHLPPKTFGVLLSLEPVIAAVFGLLFLSERITGVQVFAILCIIIASAGVLVFDRKPAPIPAP
jgi:inner membrane transporter RhtA